MSTQDILSNATDKMEKAVSSLKKEYAIPHIKTTKTAHNILFIILFFIKSPLYSIHNNFTIF